MVTKPDGSRPACGDCSVLAKIHMVTKLASFPYCFTASSVLAKIHMVTKHGVSLQEFVDRSVLAKIHMVTKLGIYSTN